MLLLEELGKKDSDHLRRLKPGDHEMADSGVKELSIIARPCHALNGA